MIFLLCAMISGMTIVLSRSINGYLSQKTNPYQSTFFNYFTGSITSLILVICTGLPYFQFSTLLTRQPSLFFGGVIGVFNVLILNIVVTKVTPIKLTLITFIAQLITGIILDYYCYQSFTLNRLLGCLIVIGGLIIYQLTEKHSTT